MGGTGMASGVEGDEFLTMGRLPMPRSDRVGTPQVFNEVGEFSRGPVVHGAQGVKGGQGRGRTAPSVVALWHSCFYLRNQSEYGFPPNVTGPHGEPTSPSLFRE